MGKKKKGGFTLSMMRQGMGVATYRTLPREFKGELPTIKQLQKATQNGFAGTSSSSGNEVRY